MITAKLGRYFFLIVLRPDCFGNLGFWEGIPIADLNLGYEMLNVSLFGGLKVNPMSVMFGDSGGDSMFGKLMVVIVGLDIDPDDEVDIGMLCAVNEDFTTFWLTGLRFG